MVKYCDKCGAELMDNARFCNKCGAEVKIINNNQNTQMANMGAVVVCPNCKQTTPMGLTHCENCGSSLENHTTAVIIGYVVTLIAGIVGIIPAIYLLTRNSGKAKTQGVFLIGLIVLWIILNLLLQSWIKYLIIFILLGLGAYLWFEDYSIFD